MSHSKIAFNFFSLLIQNSLNLWFSYIFHYTHCIMEHHSLQGPHIFTQCSRHQKGLVYLWKITGKIQIEKNIKKQLKVFKSTEDFTRFYPITDLLQLICTPRYGLCMYLRIPRTSSSYPKEKSRSASSIISNSSDCLRSRLPALMWANARVGVATMMSGFSINMGLSNKIHILILLVNK